MHGRERFENKDFEKIRLVRIFFVPLTYETVYFFHLNRIFLHILLSFCMA